MAPLNQLSVLAFATAALAVPHWDPLNKRHAHPSAPGAYWDPAPSAGGSSAPAGYGSSSDAGAASSSGIAGYGSSSAAGGYSLTASSGYAGPSGGYGSASGYAHPTGSYGWGSTGYGSPTGSYSGPASYSTCTETSTLIYRSTTEYSTYYVTHTLYPGGSSTGAASGSPSGPGGYPAGPSSSAASPAGSGAPGAPEGSCVPDVTVTTTEKSTVYVTVGPSSPAGGAPSGYPAPSGSEGAAPSASYPASWEPAPSASSPAGYSSAAPSSPAAPSSAPGGYSSPAAPSSAPGGYSSPAPSSPASASSPAGYSTSAPAPSASAPAGGYGGASGYSGKRGLAYNDAGLTNMFAKSSYVGWAYNWEPDNKGLDGSIPYIPCLHSADSMWTDIWDDAAQGAINNGGKWLFGPNEPDMTTQANLSPAAAADLWRQYMEPYAGKIGLVAPAVTSGVGEGIGISWLEEFLQECSDCTIDAVGQHWYNSNGNDVENFKDTVNAAAEKSGKPVWVNEFGAIGSDDEKADFLKQVMSWMDTNDSVLGYSYYMVSDGLLCSGDAPSTYGAVYADYSG